VASRDKYVFLEVYFKLQYQTQKFNPTLYHTHLKFMDSLNFKNA